MNVTTTKPLLTRQEVADLLCVTYDQVRRNEDRWGIRIARRDLNRRCVRYRAFIVLRILKARGFVE